MDLTEYLFDPAEIASRAAEMRANLKANRNLSDALGFAVGVIWDRLGADPLDYRAYGPYWWAVKEVLRRAGKPVGETTDGLILGRYRLSDDYETLVAAELFRDWYRETQFQHANQFVLDGHSGEFWTLYDEDVELAAEMMR